MINTPTLLSSKTCKKYIKPIIQDAFPFINKGQKKHFQKPFILRQLNNKSIIKLILFQGYSCKLKPSTRITQQSPNFTHTRHKYLSSLRKYNEKNEMTNLRHISSKEAKVYTQWEIPAGHNLIHRG